MHKANAQISTALQGRQASKQSRVSSSRCSAQGCTDSPPEVPTGQRRSQLLRSQQMCACLHALSPLPLRRNCPCLTFAVFLQVVNGSMYVAGEIKPYQTRNESVKRQLLEMVRLEGPLPDLDVYFDSQDHAEYCPLSGTSDACK